MGKVCPGDKRRTNAGMQTNHALRLVKEGDAIQEGHSDAIACSKSSIQVRQGPSGSTPNGIPMYLVEITNTCSRSCSGIHFSCGEFSSARLVNPKIFRRLRVNDCLVNDGAPLKSGLTLSFQYVTTFEYPLAVTSATC
ncbi:TPD1 protein homolog 1-like [Lycium ferocissimum]|uniref:TPD1 protein homolog 1-like n=1 Tax=Lycium ferocissimum TaxID=112874 RepID=UPI0028158085|nr:TPD1 protein homolog 1-like [Lycium ferocissimum]